MCDGSKDRWGYFHGLSRLLSLTFVISLFTFLSFGQEGRQLVAEKPKVSDKRTALVIGNANYTVARKLANPLNDATDMTAALKELGFEVVSGTDLTLKQMREKVREFGDKLTANGGVGLFYYAGHGVQTSGSNYLIPVDADIAREDEVPDYAFPLDQVFRKMATANNGFNIVILDACRNNPFARSWSRGGDTEGLAQVSAPTGTFIAYATSPDRTASDGKGRNGLYTEQLLKYVSQPNLKIEETFKEIGKSVKTLSNGNQNPWVSSDFSGDFYFKFDKRTAAANKENEPLPSPEQIIEKYINAIGGKTAIRSLRSFSRDGEFEFSVNDVKGKAKITDVWKAPNKNYTEISFPHGPYEEFFDGKAGWELVAAGYLEMSGLTLEYKKRSSTAFVFNDVSEFKKLYPTIALKGKEIVNEKAVLVVEATPETGKPELFFFDRLTGLLLRTDYYIEDSSQKGVLIPTQSYFDDYFEMSGVMLPFTIRTVSPALSSVKKFRSFPVKLNLEIDDARFQPPEDKESANSAAKARRDEIAAESLSREAAAAVAAKKFDEAIDLCSRAIALAPNNAKFHNYRGIIYNEMGQPDKAISNFTAAIKINPNIPILYANRGATHITNGNFEAAIVDLTKAIELAPESRISYSSRCTALLGMQKYDEAIRDCSKAIELDPTRASLYSDRSMVYQKMGRTDLADADKNKARSLEPKSIKP